MASERHTPPEATSLRLARHVCDQRAQELSEATREAALRCVLDLLACAAAGSAQAGVAAARAVARSQYAGRAAALWFTGDTASEAGAAFANSAAAAILDLDDGYRLARGHPGAAVIPAAMAAATDDTSAQALLTAIVAGYEVGVRVAQGRLGYAPSGVWSPYAAIAAAGCLRGTGPEPLAHALSIAAQVAPAMAGKAGQVGSDVKEGIPFGVLAGLNALHLAESGFTGPLGLLDHADHFASERITAGLGGTPSIERTYFKPYACCRHVHAPLDAFAALLERERIAARDIASIEVHTYSGTFNLSNLVEPRTLVELQYSVPFCLGVCAVHGAGALLPVDEAVLGDVAVREIARKVSLHRDPEIEARFPAQSPTRVVVTTAAGRFASPVVTPRGDPDAPLAWHELVAKFEAATGRTLAAPRRHALLSAIDRLRAGELAPLRQALAAT